MGVLNLGVERAKKSNVKIIFKVLLITLVICALYIYIVYLLTSNNDSIEAEKSENSSKRSAKYAYSKINVREGLGKSYKVINHLERGDVVEVDSLIIRDRRTSDGQCRTCHGKGIIIYKTCNGKGIVPDKI